MFNNVQTLSPCGFRGLEPFLKTFPVVFFHTPFCALLRIFRGAHLLGLRTFLNGQPIQFFAYFLLHFIGDVGINP